LSIQGNGWKSTDIILFEIAISQKTAFLKIVLGSSDDIESRNSLLEYLRPIFNVKGTTNKYTAIYSDKLGVFDLGDIEAQEILFKSIANKCKRSLLGVSDKVNQAIEEYL